MSITKNRYPLSTSSGQAIPLDVIRPSGVIRKAFTSAVGTTPEALPALTSLMLVRATKDCFIQFSNVAAVRPVSATPSIRIGTTLYLQAGEVQAISPPSLFYSVIGDVASGVLNIQLLETWAGMGLEDKYKQK